MTNEPQFSLIVPTYNERAGLERLVSSAHAVLSAHHIDAELVVVDDNSPDGTGDLAEQLAARFPMQVVHRERKLGLGSAVMAGFARARGETLGVMDADFSHPPSALPNLLAAMRALDVEMVVGSRYITGGGSSHWPWPRRLLSRAGSLLARPLTPVRDSGSGLFIVRRRAVEGVRVSAPGFKIGLELFCRGRIESVAEVPFVFTDRAAGQSKMSLREGLRYLGQLLELYALRLKTRGGAPARYRQATVEDMRRWGAVRE
jgi:dolichol-phosphate mannosyltransferase